MVIAVIALYCSDISSENYFHHLVETTRKLMASATGHRFIIFHDKNFNASSFRTQNAEFFPVRRPVYRPGLKRWLDKSFPVICKKRRIEAAIWLNGICSLPGKIPQFIFYPYPDDRKKNICTAYRQKFAGEILRSAQRIFVTDTSLEQTIRDGYGTRPEMILVVPPVSRHEPQMISEKEKESIKEQFSGGREFFAYLGDEDHASLIGILKAFSLFKKRLGTGLPLIIFHHAVPDKKFKADLASFKYKQDVILIRAEKETEKFRILAAAYGAIVFDTRDYTGIPVFDIQSMGVPVITKDIAPYRAVLTDTVLYSSPGNAGSIFENMMRLYKEETMRKQMIQKAVSLVRHLKENSVSKIILDDILSSTR
jgi:hypothetical protein